MLGPERRLLAEAAGTFMLVLIGTGAVVMDLRSGGALGTLGISLAFGAVVTAMILVFGRVSGAHINPAVSLAFHLCGRLSAGDLARYVAAQCAGAVAASSLLLLAAPGSESYGATLPHAGLLPSFILEVALTLVLMGAILAVVRWRPDDLLIIALVVGATVALNAAIGGAYTGASMNPARSLGPAIVEAQLASLWLYLIAPCIGAALAVFSCRRLGGAGCCRA